MTKGATTESRQNSIRKSRQTHRPAPSAKERIMHSAQIASSLPSRPTSILDLGLFIGEQCRRHGEADEKEVRTEDPEMQRRYSKIVRDTYYLITAAQSIVTRMEPTNRDDMAVQAFHLFSLIGNIITNIHDRKFIPERLGWAHEAARHLLTGLLRSAKVDISVLGADYFIHDSDAMQLAESVALSSNKAD